MQRQRRGQRHLHGQRRTPFGAPPSREVRGRVEHSRDRRQGGRALTSRHLHHSRDVSCGPNHTGGFDRRNHLGPFGGHCTSNTRSLRAVTCVQQAPVRWNGCCVLRTTVKGCQPSEMARLPWPPRRPIRPLPFTYTWRHYKARRLIGVRGPVAPLRPKKLMAVTLSRCTACVPGSSKVRLAEPRGLL